MAATYRSYAYASGGWASRANSTTCDKPTGAVDGDLLVAFLNIGRDTTLPTPSPPDGSWNAVPGSPFTTLGPHAGFSTKLYAWYKIASSEGANYTFTHTSITISTELAIFAIQGADESTPFSPTSTSATGVGNTAVIAPSITTPADGGLVFFVTTSWGDTANTLSAPSGTTPTFSSRHNIAASVSSVMYVGTGEWSSHGATGDKSQVTNSSNALVTNIAVLASVQPTGGTQHEGAATLTPAAALVANAAVIKVLFPDVDSVDGGWTNESASNTDLFASLTEIYPDDDETYIRSGNSPSSDTVKIGLSNPTGGAMAPMTLRYRYRKQGTGTINLTVRLLEGTTELWTATHNNITASYVTAEPSVVPNPPINDPTNLFLEFIATEA